MYGIEEAVKCAQRGGVGIVLYFRKEGASILSLLYHKRRSLTSLLSLFEKQRALGEVLPFPLSDASSDHN